MTGRTFVPTHQLRPLPLPIKPVPRETTSSYVDRLAKANRLDSQALRAYLAGTHLKSQPIPVARLAVLSGQDKHTLLHALADLQGRRPDPTPMIRHACHPCAASCQATGPVTVQLQPQDLVCRNHNRWIGRSWTQGDAQPRLTNHPEITQANNRHRRIIRAHGAEAARTAYHVAAWVCERWRQQGRHQQLFNQLLARYHPPAIRIALADATVEASAYPQVIALTRILASTHWNELPFGNDEARTRFQNEVRRTVAPRFEWDVQRPIGHVDPLIRVYLDEMTLRDHTPPAHETPETPAS